jgi:hypothetical protein
MSANWASRALGWAAALAVAAGAVWTVSTLASRGATAARLDRRAAELQHLRAMESESVRRRAMIAALDRTGGGAPISVSTLVQNVLPGLSADVRAREPEAAASGWRARRVDVDLAGVPFERAAAFMSEAERCQPPWRVIECSVRASRQGEGLGQVRLVLESLEKAP